ncbi:hypothetical protein QL285_080078 [Trifolium repens]|nr:hypothetical protein QL285_080078 [Trifolium repens]
MKQARRGRVVIAQSETWRRLVAVGRYWSLGDHMNFWVREEHMNPRLQRRICGLASKPRFSCSAHGSVRKNHICWIKVMAIWCTFHKIKVEGNLVYLTYREEKKSKYTKSEGNGYTFKS